MSNVRLTLAHHLDGPAAARLGLPAEDLRPGTDIAVPEDVAHGLIGAGYAAVEVERPEQVAKALRRRAPKDHPVGVISEPEESEDDGKTIAEKVDPQVAVAPSEGVPPSARRKAADKD